MLCQPSYQSMPSFRIGTQACAASSTRSTSPSGNPSTGSSDLRSRNSVASTRSVAWSDARSEEHTSELQSLMRISYAVFCLKKKIPDYNQQNSESNQSIL